VDPSVGAREAHLRDHWRLVWQGRYTVLAIFVAVVGLTLLRVMLATPIYQAHAVIEIKPEARRILPGQEQWVGAEGGGWLGEEKYFDTQLEILRSRDVAEKTFRQLRLQDHPQFKNASDPIAAFRGRVTIQPTINTRLVTLRVSGTDPKEVTDWVNALAEVYVKRNVDKATDSFRTIMDQIEREMKQFRKNLGDADLDRMESAKEAEILVPESQQDVVQQNLRTYNDSLTRLNVEIAALRSEVDGYARARAEGRDVLTVASIAQDPTIQDLLGQRQSAEKELRQIGGEKKPGHPAYLAKQAELEKIKQRMEHQVESVYDKLQTRLRLSEGNATYLTGQINKTEQEAYRIKQATSNYELQKVDAANQRKVYDVVAETLNRLAISAQLVSMNNNVSIVDRAIEPRSPIKPRKFLSLVVGGVLGLLFGIALVFFLDYLDNTVRSPEDIEQFLGLSILGVIPKYRERDSLEVREAFQSLRTSILFSSQNREKNVILLTSAGPQEGKSSTVAMIARTMASAGERVVVLDCDLRRPTMHQVFGIAREPGITNYLLEGHGGDHERYAQATDLPTLRIMPCGAIPPNPAELVGLTRFHELVDALKRSYDWVLIDTPPVATLADSVVLASKAELIALVIKHNQNDRELIRRSLKRLRDIHAPIVGAVLNGVDLQRSAYGDYYYAGYHYQNEAAGRRGTGARGRRSKSADSPRKIAL
jgi:capsular exopolysaccharide synthesis family protein